MLRRRRPSWRACCAPASSSSRFSSIDRLAVTGDPPEEADYPGARGVYEVDAIGLTELLTRLNKGEDWHGRTIDAPTSFYVGVAVNPTADDLDLELERFQRKLDAGAQYAM